MNYTVITKDNITYIECLPDGGVIKSERDALDLVAACGENSVDRLLLYEENLAEDFFHLSSGLAGAVLLKFTNYWIRAAAVISSERAGKGKFGEMVLETNRGWQFHVSPTRAEAEAWLIALS